MTDTDSADGTPLPGRGELAADTPEQAGEQDPIVVRDPSRSARDLLAEQRDQLADLRDHAASQRDDAADSRDAAADLRDRAAEASQDLGSPPEVLNSSARVRREAAADRRRAWEDRAAGAEERRRSGVDRITAMVDRGASAQERAGAGVDDLTGVRRRGAGLEELQRQMNLARHTGRPLVVAFIDVNHLKDINDSLGHAAGDQILREVTSALRTQLRFDDLTFRYGGDEFVSAVTGLTLAEATERFAAINERLADKLDPGSVTFGLTEMQPDDTPDGLVARADAALYRERRLQRE